MAKSSEKIRGKVGRAVFYKVGDVTRVRSAATQYRDANTPEQQGYRSRLRVATRFYQSMMNTMLQEAWRVGAGTSGGNGYNFFMRRNVKVFGANGKIIDFSQLELVVGMLQQANLLRATREDGDRVVLQWETEGLWCPARKEDELVVVVLYGSRSFTPVFVDTGGVTRGDGRAMVQLSRKLGTAAHMYVFFKEKNGKGWSKSEYFRF